MNKNIWWIISGLILVWGTYLAVWGDGAQDLGPMLALGLISFPSSVFVYLAASPVSDFAMKLGQTNNVPNYVNSLVLIGLFFCGTAQWVVIPRILKKYRPSWQKGYRLGLIAISFVILSYYILFGGCFFLSESEVTRCTNIQVLTVVLVEVSLGLIMLGLTAKWLFFRRSISGSRNE